MHRIFLLVITLAMCVLGISCTNSKDMRNDEKNINSYENSDTAKVDDVSIETILLKKNKSHAEFDAIGYIVLGEDEKGEIKKEYILFSHAGYGFENEIFTPITGSWDILAVITFKKAKSGEYSFLKYSEASKGKAIKKIFPAYLHKDLFNEVKYKNKIQAQLESQARAYLKAIGREKADIKDYVDMPLPEVDSKFVDEMLLESNSRGYPLGIGTREELEKGIRYVYSQEYDFNSKKITFTKTKEDGTIVEKYIVDTLKEKLIFLVGIDFTSP